MWATQRLGCNLLLLLLAVYLAAYGASAAHAAGAPAAEVALGGRPAPSSPQQLDGYMSVAEVERRLRDLADRYADLATLIDIGDSWERVESAGASGHAIWALQIASARYPAPKPVFTMFAAIHANEMPTTELAIRFVELLLAGYGHDADLTWLIDEHVILVVPILNPDARSLPQPTRKTTAAISGTSCRGIDLNRNFPYAWGGVGSSDSPCSFNYRGGSPASEPETQAAMALLRTWYPGRVPLGAEPHPDTTSGVMLSLHTSGRLVLYPWAHTSAPAPNHAALAQLAAWLVATSRYDPLPAYNLYPHSGRLDDWAYAELGLAAFTFEIGGQGHAPPFATVDAALWPENRDAFLYALRVSGAPYRLPFGPNLTAIVARERPDGIEVLATIDGPIPAGSATLYLGSPPWRGGTPIAMAARDGSMDSLDDQLYARISRDQLAALGPGPHALYLQAATGDAKAGPLRAIWDEPAQPTYWVMLPLLGR